MGGNRAAYATTRHHRHDDVHSVRRGQPTDAPDNQDETSPSSKRSGSINDTARPFYSDDEDEDDDDAIAEREQAALRERDEMRRQFMFQEPKRRSLRNDIVSAMRRKRRMLMRNENLRFRELYKPPEPGVVLTVIAMVTIVTLILTKSWPFY